MSSQSEFSWADRSEAGQSDPGPRGPSGQSDAGPHDPSGRYGPWGPWGACGSHRYGQYRTRGFAPLFRGVYSDQHLRVSDGERQAVVDRLAEHFAEGRLDQAEFDERSARAMSAKTRADLNGLFDDLPETGAPAVPELPPRRHRHPVLLLALVVVTTLAAAHVLAWATWVSVPWLWLGLLALALLFATGHVGRSRARQDR